MSGGVPRYRTALTRKDLSRPLKCLFADELLVAPRTVFDFGCGKGDDVRHLKDAGYDALGWDPTHFPGVEPRPSDVVTLNYVVNVIEDQRERSDVLTAAWALARGVLVVAARLIWEDKTLGSRPFADGVITRAGTFQKFYEHAALGQWIETVLGERPIAAAQGIYYVFRDSELAQQFLATRAIARRRAPMDLNAAYELHRERLGPIIEFLALHARLPQADELPADKHNEIVITVGSWSLARRLAEAAVTQTDWVQVSASRRAELLVYLGLSQFYGRPAFGDLPRSLARDIRAQWPSYKLACRDADQVLFATADVGLRQLAARGALVGKRTPSAIYVHRDALGLVSPVLRLYEGCARLLAGTVDDANIVKLGTLEHQVSYLTYPDFERHAHPALHAAVTVNLRRMSVERRSYDGDNPPVLHRKEQMVADDHTGRDIWARLTSAEERAGLYAHPERIGTLAGWRSTLEAQGLTLRGHRLVRVRRHGS